MLCAVAVVQGFKQQITNKIAGFNAHLQIYRLVEDNSDPEADNLLTLTPTLRSILDSEPYVAGYEMELNMPVILKTPQDFKGIYIKGTDGSDIRSFLGSQLTAGKMPDFSLPSTAYDLALSQKMADDLGLKVGDSIPAFFMNDELRAQKYRVAATYSTHFEQFDDLIALGNIAPLREMANIGQGQGVNIRVVTTDFDLADEYADRLRKRLNSAYTSGEVAIPYRVESVTDRSAAYFSWLSLLDTNVTVILTLMTIVAFSCHADSDSRQSAAYWHLAGFGSNETKSLQRFRFHGPANSSVGNNYRKRHRSAHSFPATEISFLTP